VTSGAPAGIHDLAHLADFVARQRAHAALIAETAGGFVVESTDPVAKRWWATVASRHGWHAELWADRYPTIPGLDLDRATAAARPALQAVADSLTGGASDDERTARYQAVVDRLRTDLSAVRRSLDDRLDAPTARVLDLVLTDLNLPHPDLPHPDLPHPPN
jgi:hypothetical protein